MHPLRDWDDDGSVRPVHKHAASRTGWRLSIVAGYLAVSVLVLVVFLIVVYGSQGLRERLDPLVPRPVAEFFNPAPKPAAATADQTTIGDKARIEVEKVLPRPPAQSRIRVGSTKEDVLAVQGKPDSATETVWRYGQSEVYFKNGRVTGYRKITAGPLKVR
jgi:hypothetical protein